MNNRRRREKLIAASNKILRAVHIMEEEQDYFNNLAQGRLWCHIRKPTQCRMPEASKTGENGQAAEAAIGKLEAAVGYLKEAAMAVEDAAE